MKNLVLFSILMALFSVNVFAEGEAETECPMMREMNKRVNTKANLSNQVKKPAQKGHKASSV